MKNNKPPKYAQRFLNWFLKRKLAEEVMGDLEEEYAKKINDEERIGKLSGFSTLLAIIISCIGVFGLAAYMAERRTKEIGIRKVLGASIGSIWQMLSKDFLLLVLLACFLAIPIAWYYLQEWLANFEYRTTLSAWIFMVAGLSVVILAIEHQ